MEALEKNGELTLEQIAKLITIKHKDHRDFYILASLITLGLIDDDLLKNKVVFKKLCHFPTLLKTGMTHYGKSL